MNDASSNNPYIHLQRLNAREWAALKAVCEGEIGFGTMFGYRALRKQFAQIYIKLGLDSYQPSIRRRILYQEIIPAIQEMNIETSSIISLDDKSKNRAIPRRVLKMVREDEKFWTNWESEDYPNPDSDNS